MRIGSTMNHWAVKVGPQKLDALNVRKAMQIDKAVLPIPAMFGWRHPYALSKKKMPQGLDDWTELICLFTCLNVPM